MRDVVTRAVQELIRQPCTVPGCRCLIQEILAALEQMLALRDDDQRNKQTKLGKEYDAPDEERLTWLPRDGGRRMAAQRESVSAGKLGATGGSL